MSYVINDEIIEKVRETSDIVDIVSRYVSLKRSGNNYIGLCPFHNEKKRHPLPYLRPNNFSIVLDVEKGGEMLFPLL